MDSVQRFISENQHQLGYIMNEASRQWIKNDKVGALTVGDCNFVVEKYGQYHEILDELEKIKPLYEEVIKFMKDNDITCDETIYQCDSVIENVYEFIDKLFNIVKDDLHIEEDSDEY